MAPMEESEDPKLNLVVSKLAERFSEEQAQLHGGILCSDIAENDPKIRASRCPRIAAAVSRKVHSRS
jgi:hypothetical protein